MNDEFIKLKNSQIRAAKISETAKSNFIMQLNTNEKPK